MVKKLWKKLIFNSNYDKEKLNSIYSNLDTISFFRLLKDTEELVKKGYNLDLLEEKSIFISLYLFSSYGLFSNYFTLNDTEKKQNTYYILLAIITCVFNFLFKNFSTALGATERIPLIISVWAPVLILSIFCSVGILQIYDK